MGPCGSEECEGRDYVLSKFEVILVDCLANIIYVVFEDPDYYLLFIIFNLKLTNILKMV